MELNNVTNNVLIKTVYPYANFYLPEGNNNYPSLFQLKYKLSLGDN